jgi:hypothetical protein
MEHLIAIAMVLVAASAGLRMLPRRRAGRDHGPRRDDTSAGSGQRRHPPSR